MRFSLNVINIHWQSGRRAVIIYGLHSSANTRRWPNVVPMLGHRLRRWPNIETTLDQSLIAARGIWPMLASCWNVYQVRNRHSASIPVRGLVKLKKIQKSEKTQIVQTPPTHPPIQFFFETCTTKKTTQKNTIIDPPTHFRVFLGFFGFFSTWQNP